MGQRRTYRKAQVALGLSGLCQVQGDMNVAPLLHMQAAYSGQRQKPASDLLQQSHAALRLLHTAPVDHESRCVALPLAALALAICALSEHRIRTVV